MPKITHPDNLLHFRPISLCTIFYKIVSKTIAYCFQKVLNVCIDEAQSAFIPCRLITNNILLAYEILHSFKKRRMRRKSFYAFRLDTSKAYDKVE